MTVDVLAELQRLRDRGETAVLATVVWRHGPSSGQVGGKALVHPDGRVQGWIGGACAEPAVRREALDVLERGASRLVHLGPPDELPDPPPDGTVCVPIACESEGALQVFLEPVLAPPHLVVAGRTVAVEVLVAMASALGWESVVVDPDRSADRHGGAHVVSSLGEAGVTGRSMIVVASQGHHDEEVLEAALATDAAYVGLVASRTRSERMLAYLRDRGTPADALDRIQAPAGLDLGPTGHEEIAVSVLAELVRLRAAGALPRGGEVTAVETDGAVDPVCGMTVPTTGPHTATVAGRTYHFCCPGCRAAFEADPAAYLEVTS